MIKNKDDEDLNNFFKKLLNDSIDNQSNLFKLFNSLSS